MNFLLQMVLLLFRYQLTKNNVQSVNALRTLLVTHHTVTTLQIYEVSGSFLIDTEKVPGIESATRRHRNFVTCVTE